MHASTKERLKFIEEYLRNGNQPTFKELLNIVSNRFKEIKERRLHELLKYLREEGINGVPLQIECDENNRYSINNHYRFHYANLLNSERATLPLLFGLLQPYRSFPAVKTLMNNIIEVHKLDKDAVHLLSLVIGSNSNHLGMPVFEKIMKGMTAIYEQVMVEFHYIKVKEGVIKAADEKISEVVLLPLQVRIHDGRYYLIGIKKDRELKMQYLQSFAFDMIQRGPDPYYLTEEDEEPQKFDWKKVAEKVNLERCYDHSFGVFRDFSREEPPQNIYRWFKGWAASYVRAVPIHPSQVIVQEMEDGSIRVRLSVYQTVDLDSYFQRFGEFSWVD